MRTAAATAGLPAAVTRLRIAHFLLGRCNPESANGVDKMVYHLSRAQAAAGHDVRILSLTPKPAIPVPGVDVRTYRGWTFPSGILPAGAVDLLVDRSPFNLPPALVSDLFEDPPDVLHFHHTRVPQAVRIGRRLRNRGIPYCVTPHGALVQRAVRRRRWLKGLFMNLVERRYLDGAAFVHALSPLDADGIRASGIRAPIVEIPNGLDLETLPSAEGVEIPALRERLSARRVLVFVGRLDPEQKGLDLLLDAVAAVPDVGLALVGPSFRDGRDRLEARAGRLGLTGRVVFAGPKHGAEKMAYLAAADAFVYPSRWEGLPLAPLEAAAASRPLVLTPAADASGWLAADGAAIPCDPDVDSIASAIVRLRDLPEERLAEMGRNARRCVETRFDWTDIARRIVDAYVEYGVAR